MTSHVPARSADAHGSQQPEIVLIHPPAVSKRYMQTKFMPYGMAVIYSYLKARSINVAQYDFLMEYLFQSPEDVNYHSPDKSFTEQDYFSCLDGNCDHPGLTAFVEKYGSRIQDGAGLYAFSIVAYHQSWASLLLGKLIKRRNPDATIVFGGPFITIRPPEAFVGRGVADYWIKGNGEIPILTIHRMRNSDAGLTKRDIPGALYFEGNELVVNEKSALPAADEAPPDFKGLDLSQYRYDHPLTGEQTLFIPYRLSKGCPSSCSFCTGRLVDRYEVKSVDKIVSELRGLSRTYKTDNFMFADASVNGSPGMLAKLCDRLVSEYPGIRWYAYSRVRGFSAELLEKAKAAGCFSLFWGVESAHPPTIELLGKRFEAKVMFDTLDRSIALGIKNYVHLIYNTPHETEEDIRSLTGLIDRYLDSDMVVFLPGRFLLEPQSLMHETPDKYGMRNLQRVDKGIFEREQYTYEESGGLDHRAVEARNELHRRLLADHLELIQYANMRKVASGRTAKWVSPRLLLQTGKLASRSSVAARIHRRLVGFLRSRAGLSEQM